MPPVREELALFATQIRACKAKKRSDRRSDHAFLEGRRAKGKRSHNRSLRKRAILGYWKKNQRSQRPEKELLFKNPPAEAKTAKRTKKTRPSRSKRGVRNHTRRGGGELPVRNEIRGKRSERAGLARKKAEPSDFKEESRFSKTKRKTEKEFNFTFHKAVGPETGTPAYQRNLKQQKGRGSRFGRKKYVEIEGNRKKESKVENFLIFRRARGEATHFPQIALEKRKKAAKITVQENKGPETWGTKAHEIASEESKAAPLMIFREKGMAGDGEPTCVFVCNEG